MNKKKVMRISIIIFIILLIMGTLFIYTKNNDFREFMDIYVFRKEVYENNLPTIKIDNINHNIHAYNGSIVMLNQNTLESYNKMGYEEYSLDIKATTPIFDSNGNYLCVADKNGKNIYLISGRNILWQKELEGKIYNISVNKNGYVAVTISDAGYTIIETYNNNGVELFKTYLPTSNVVDIDISNDNKYLAIAETNLSGIIIQSNIKIISMEDAKKSSVDSIKYTHMAKADDLIINIKYNNRNDLICMYDGHVDTIKEDNNVELTNFTNENALFVDINLNSNIIKVIKQNTGIFNSTIEMQILDSNDVRNKVTYTIGQSPKSIYTYGNMICINLGTEVLFINNSGWLVKRYKSSGEAQGVIMCDDLAGIIYKNKIEIISL